MNSPVLLDTIYVAETFSTLSAGERLFFRVHHRYMPSQIRHNLIHGDISVRNVFVTAATVAKVGDLQGQLYGPDGTTVEFASFTNENSQSRHPHADEDEFSPRTDIFALGTLLYCLWHGQLPFPELNEFYQEEEIQARYRRGEYPLALAEATGIDKIICKCWHSKYNQMVEILKDMEELGVKIERSA